MKMFKKVMEIKAKTGKLHFIRWAIIECSKFNIYLHYIAHSDMDRRPHNHPWKFVSVVLNGGYCEAKYEQIKSLIKRKINRNTPGSIIKNTNLDNYHKIRLVKPTYTLVFTGPRINDDWGYLMPNGEHVTADEYRKLKNTPKPPTFTKDEHNALMQFYANPPYKWSKQDIDELYGHNPLKENEESGI